MKIIKTYLNTTLCSTCGGRCCQHAPGECIPQDFGNTYEEIKGNLSKALKSGFYSVDWWEGKSRAWEGNRGFYVLPRALNSLHFGVTNMFFLEVVFNNTRLSLAAPKIDSGVSN